MVLEAPLVSLGVALLAVGVLALLGGLVLLLAERRRRDRTAHPPRDAAPLDDLLGDALFEPHDGPLTPPPEDVP